SGGGGAVGGRGAVAGLLVARVGGAVERRAAAPAAAGAGVVERAGVAVVARRARAGGHRAARRAVAGPGVALVGGAGDRRADALAAAVAGVVEGAGVAVVAARARERGHRAARRAVAGPRVALVRGAGDRRADALSAAVTGVVESAGVAVVAARAGERRHRAARRAVAGAGVALIRGAGDGGADALPAAVGGVVERAGVAVVARRARGGGHGAARRAVAGAGVARIRGAGDGGAAALSAAGAGVDEPAGVAVFARRARVGGHGAARRAVAGAGVARMRGAGDGGVVADARVTGVDGAGVLVVAVGGGRAW